MQDDEFIKHVQSVALLDSPQEAHATSATLETLKERIVGDEASQLAAQCRVFCVKNRIGAETIEKEEIKT